MVTILKRMRRLQTLLDIRLGPGAAVISRDVKRIHLLFARKMYDGHMGPRKFWRAYLPRLKYHNPAIPMTVERTDDQDGPATMTVFFATPSSKESSSAAPSSSTSGNTAASKHNPFEEAKTINMKHRKEGDILADLLEMANGEPVTATPEDEEQLKTLEEEMERGEKDRALLEEVKKKRKRADELLQRAKQSA